MGRISKAQEKLNSMYKKQFEWKKANTKKVVIDFRTTGEKNDLDILEKLDSVESKADYIRSLIRADIEKNGK